MRFLSIVFFLCALAAAGASSAQLRTALPYRTLDPVMAPIGGLLGDSPRDKIEVLQFFYYGCPHCFDMQPLIEDWLAKKPADVEFRYIPALRDEKWQVLTRAYFALEKLGQAKRLHRPIYDVINFDGAQLTDEQKLFDWVARNGIERSRFVEAFNADDTRARVEAARKLTVDYNIRATPTMVVAGKYLFSSGQAGSHFDAMKMLDQFVDVARRERK